MVVDNSFLSPAPLAGSDGRDDVSSPSHSHVVGTPSSQHFLARQHSVLPAAEGFLNFSDVELICPIQADDIQNRWLNNYIPVPGQQAKNYSPNTTGFIYRMLKSYAGISTRGGCPPPFIHPLQVADGQDCHPLSTCLTLVRLFDKPVPGGESVAAEVLKREMARIFELHTTYTGSGVLQAFQAYLVYTMVIFFSLGQESKPFCREAVMNLQVLACSAAKIGLVCKEEQQHSRPPWEAWILAEAKRRTLYTMYLFDSMLASQDGAPTFLGIELRGLLAPGGKSLWRAETRREWVTAYNFFLVRWGEGGLKINELWPIPAEFNDLDIVVRQQRVEQWLEDIDEFGITIYAITSATHGS
ncbi:unnamed protein product [Clonostachys chloroleuca]|uniref:Transcription factor domain-containing protein n=1 Tax=Clonostachys chloroleuca TaxID=1926264 RepID=A0AA35Q182_9HYPO|nr:unnamed protein product [Clonostachys chloroleuca]